MSHNGKIARLPREIREQLNRRLQNGEQGKQLVVWLNSLSEVQQVLAETFGGRSITQQNLSEWRKRGYPEWQAQQEALDVARQMAADADELHQEGGHLTDKMAVWLTARYLVAARKLNEAENGDVANWKHLRELCNDIVALRRGDHYAERLQIERERLADERREREKEQEKLFWEWAAEHRDEICRGFMNNADKLELLGRQMFGETWDKQAKTPPGGGVSSKCQCAPPVSDSIRLNPTKSNQLSE